MSSSHRKQQSVTVVDSHGQPITFLIQPSEELPSYRDAVLEEEFSPAPSNEPEESTPLLPAPTEPRTVLQTVKVYFSPLVKKTYWKNVAYLLLLNFPIHLLVWLLAYASSSFCKCQADAVTASSDR